MAQGIGMSKISQRIQTGFVTGEFKSPGRPGVAYMLSDQIRTFDPKTREFGTFPPHLMFYAPHVSNEDIGWTPDAAQQNPWLPFIAYEGPHGYMIVVPPEGKAMTRQN